jgi:hypothetical protein
MTIESHGHEHELEPQYGLPERLPANEKILWQGSPDARVLARSAFHIRKLALYFVALVAINAASVVTDGATAMDVLLALVWPAGLSALALGGVWTLAWLTARTAVYTVTDRRVVMRIGIVLTLTFNLPLRRIASDPAAGPSDVLAILQDATTLKRMEAQYVQSQKMQAQILLDGYPRSLMSQQKPEQQSRGFQALPYLRQPVQQEG